MILYVISLFVTLSSSHFGFKLIWIICIVSRDAWYEKFPVFVIPGKLYQYYWSTNFLALLIREQNSL